MWDYQLGHYGCSGDGCGSLPTGFKGFCWGKRGGKGGTGKTFLYKTIISRLRSERKIVLALASSGIATLLLPPGRTTHSRQILPVIPKGKRADIVQACINRSVLWKHCKDFNQWVLAVGDGKLPAKMKDVEDEPTWIEIPEKFLINSAIHRLSRLL
nr:hypothetical protein [Tanacetum cinerariifolium]